MAVTITHVFLWGSSATNHIENALMGSPCLELPLLLDNSELQIEVMVKGHRKINISYIMNERTSSVHHYRNPKCSLNYLLPQILQL
jgi:hypothetical protein